MGDRDRCTAPRVHVRLGEDHGICPDRLVEFESTGHGIIAGNRFIHIHHKVGLHNPFYLVELAHQVRLVVEPACSICKDHVDLMRSCILHRIKEHCRRVATFRVLDDLDPEPFGMDADLLDSTGTVRIAASDHDREPLLF